MTNYPKWDLRFMRLACEARTWVKGPDLGVGACLASPDNRGFSLGYSGLPRGMKDNDNRITDPAFKDFHIVHAELNAILNASRSVVGWTMYSTTFPCSNCASAIIQAGITRIVAPVSPPGCCSRWAPHWEHASMAFEEAGVNVFPYEGELPCD